MQKPTAAHLRLLPANDADKKDVTRWQGDGIKLLAAAIVSAERALELMGPRAKDAGALNAVKSGIGLLRRGKELVVDTLPNKRRAALNRELSACEIFLRVNKVQPYCNDDYDYQSVSRTTLKYLVDAATGGSCDFCGKSPEMIRRCRLRQLFDGLLDYDVPEVVDGACKWAQYDPENEVTQEGVFGTKP